VVRTLRIGLWTRRPSRNRKRSIEEAVAEIVVTMGLKKLPLLPARHTMHLMATAAKRLSRTASTD
jgi:hypothetical protein